MSSSLTQLVELVAEVSMSNAIVARDRLVQLVPYIPENIRAKVLATFVFMNWTFASGVWSNLSNKRMRRDLQIELKDALTLKLARTLTGSSAPADIAARAVALTAAFNAYLQDYGAKVQSRGGADSRVATLFALEQIQATCNLTDAVLNAIVPELVSMEGSAANVESVANEVNKVASHKRERFFGRFFQRG